jgi:hypothetical protein
MPPTSSQAFAYEDLVLLSAGHVTTAVPARVTEQACGDDIGRSHGAAILGGQQMFRSTPRKPSVTRRKAEAKRKWLGVVQPHGLCAVETAT